MTNNFDYHNMLNTIRGHKISKTKTPQFSEDEISGWNNAIELCYKIVKRRRDKFEQKEAALPLQNVRYSSLILITDEKPLIYESGEWDGLRSDLVLIKNNRDNYSVGRLYKGRMDGTEFEEWYTDDDYEIQGEIVGWQKLPR